MKPHQYDSPSALTYAQPCVHFPLQHVAAYSAMYNAFVDADVLATIHDVASRLAASAASPEEWASSELGRFVQFTDNRSQNRVRKILSRYTDRTLQEQETLLRVKRERSALAARYFPAGKSSLLASRAKGLSSFCLAETMAVDSDLRHECTILATGGIFRSHFRCLARNRCILCTNIRPGRLVQYYDSHFFTTHPGARLWTDARSRRFFNVLRV